ncbi:oligosaccharide flippase family protein [Nibribacter ruber]|uniref:Oligosaccharide flippase family protein n=1 Tax=Nibribacter ruber TaxID=2698458 RepID=A0A6P1NUW3_9BACT|nr:polysaccharide biosynthesis C-terminal domain-containing protein [Nibribacter ruber]QHL86124.1 oligosaccharide flippase family protein [Nibribacter ruber]
MDTIRKQGFLNTIISYAGMIIGYVNLVVLFPVLIPDADELGLTRFLISVAAIYAQFAALGFTNISAKYFPYFRDRDKKHNGFLFLMLLIPLAGFAVVTVLFMLLKPAVVDYFGKNSPLAVEYYYYIIPLSFFTLLFILLDAYLRSLYKTVVQSFLKDFLERIMMLASVVCYAWGWVDFQWFLVLFIGANSAVTFVSIVYLLWLRQFFVRPNRNMFQVVPMREVVQYGLFSFLGNVSSSIITFIDQAMIAHYLGLDGVAYYTTGYFITSAIMVPSRGLNKIVYPQVADYFKAGNMAGLKVLYRKMTRVNMVVGFLLFLGIWCNVNNIFAIMPKDFSQGKYVILFMGLSRLFDLATGINGMILLTSNKYRYDLYFNLLMMALVAYTNYLLIPDYGISGAAFASMVVFVVYNLFRVILVARFFKMQPFGWDSLLIVVISLLAFGVSWMLPQLPNVILDIAVRSVLITAVYGGLLVLLKISPEVNNGIQKTLVRFGFREWKWL